MDFDNSIAILPFVNMSSNLENEYFSDGITEEIINALSKIKNLNVISRTSSFYYKGKTVPLAEIGKALNVSAILEGSVRLSNNTLRITAQLINAKDGFHFWSESWDRKWENIFAIQDEISLIIAEKLRENMGHFEIHDNLVHKQTDNLEAYEYFLKGKYHYQKWNPADVKTAIGYFETAIKLDPKHALSYIGLSDAHSFLGGLGLISGKDSWRKASELSNQALKLNSQSPEVYFSLANINFWTSRDLKKSLQLTYTALDIKPSFALAHQFIAILFVLSQNRNKAFEHIEIAINLDPLSSEVFFSYGFIQYLTEDYSKALNILDKSLNINPKNILANTIKCCCLLKLNRLDEVISHFDTLPEEAIIPADKTGLTGLAHLMKGDRIKASEAYGQLIELSKNENETRAEGYRFLMDAVAGENDKAFKWVQEGIDSNSTLLVVLFLDPIVSKFKKRSQI